MLFAGAGACTASAQVHRCEIDGVVTYRQAACPNQPVVVIETDPKAEIEAARREQCKRRSAFAAATVEGRLAGVEHDCAREATQGANASLLSVVDAVYAAEDEKVHEVPSAVFERCMARARE